jgi:hypothetical protein
MKHSISFSEALRKVMLLIETIKDEEERLAYMTVITEIASRFTGNNGLMLWRNVSWIQR